MLARPTIRPWIALCLACGAVAIAPGAATAQIPGLPPLPIPGPTLTPVEPFEGSAWTPAPISAGVPPQHPFMAANGRSNLHNDAYMTDTYRVSGPLGRQTTTNSSLFFRECASVTFDRQGRIVTICVGLDLPVLALLDPTSLAVLAAMPLPPRLLTGSTGNPLQDFSGGGYFYLDHRDHAIIPTSTRQIWDVALTETPLGPRFQLSRVHDVSGAVPQGEGIVSVLPDWSGRLWFVSRGGTVGTIDPGSGAVNSLRLNGEGISNSFSVDETGGAFIVSDGAMYRFDAGPGGEPQVSWREVYENSGIHKPGQSDAGSGTTPTVMGRDWVAITDNADPMNVVVYRRERNLTAPSRHVCSQPVFKQGAGNTDQSLIATDDALIAENNYGYSGPLATQGGRVTEPGLARVDVLTHAPEALAAPAQAQVQKKKKKKRKKKRKRRRKRKKGRNGKGRPGKDRAARQVVSCRLAWESSERAPSVVPKLSLANGLVYTYTKPVREDRTDAWYFTALDFRTGATVFKRLAGVGLGFNNHYAPVTLGPDGSAYVGVLGGLTRFRDAP